MKGLWRTAFWFCFGFTVVLLMPAVVLASNCGSLDDCWGMARGAAAAAAGAGVAAAASTDSGEGNAGTGDGSSDSSGGAEGN